MRVLQVAMLLTLGTNGAVAKAGLSANDEPSDGCPPCNLFFTRLELGEDGSRVQHVEVQERGEPRSGTGSMFDWAGESIIHTCNYLKQLFGEESCTIETKFYPYLTFCSMSFQPTLAGGNGSCVCHGVDR